VVVGGDRMARKDTLKMTKEDLFFSGKSLKLFHRSEDLFVNREKEKIEKRVMYFEEGKVGKQFAVVETMELEEIYDGIHMVFDYKNTMIAKRARKGAVLQFTGKGDAYGRILQRLSYNQKLKINARIYRLNKK
jgi:dissimilatory sulfite reductase (desulfoviridin) alpha/beta subunit